MCEMRGHVDFKLCFSHSTPRYATVLLLRACPGGDMRPECVSRVSSRRVGVSARSGEDEPAIPRVSIGDPQRLPLLDESLVTTKLPRRGSPGERLSRLDVPPIAVDSLLEVPPMAVDTIPLLFSHEIVTYTSPASSILSPENPSVGAYSNGTIHSTFSPLSKARRCDSSSSLPEPSLSSAPPRNPLS